MPIDNLATVGLPEPSAIQACKLATVEAQRRELLGRLGPETAEPWRRCRRP